MFSESIGISVLGAGIAGLSLTKELSEKAPNIPLKIIDKNSQVGGLIASTKVEGFLFEEGPQALYPRGKKGEDFLSFLEDLDLHNSIVPADSSSKNRYIHDKKMLKVPSSFKDMFFSPWRKVLLEAFCTDWKLSSFPAYEESVSDFSNRHFGKSFTTLITEPLLAGMWAGDIKKLSMNALYPQMKIWEQKEGSLLKTLFSLQKDKWITRIKNRKIFQKDDRNSSNLRSFSFEGGLSQLNQRLLDKSSVSLHLNETIKHISYDGSFYTVVTDRGTHKSKTIVSALPTFVLSDLIKDFAPDLSQKLLCVSYAPIAVIHCAFLEKVSSLEGFGYLKVKKSDSDILGVVFNDKLFPSHIPLNGQCFTVMIGGALFPSFASVSEDNFVQMALDALKKDLNIERHPDIVKSRILRWAIPQYNMGHTSLLQELLKRTPPNFHLVGNYLLGASVIDTIYYSRQKAATIVKLHEKSEKSTAL